jgi:hypothetical protein
MDSCARWGDARRNKLWLNQKQKRLSGPKEKCQMECFLGLKKPGLAVVCLALFTVLGAFSASAQTSNGTIVGTVLDKSGSAVPKAKITGSSSELGVVREFTTDSTGSYRLENLPPGS